VLGLYEDAGGLSADMLGFLMGFGGGDAKLFLLILLLSIIDVLCITATGLVPLVLNGSNAPPPTFALLLPFPGLPGESDMKSSKLLLPLLGLFAIMPASDEVGEEVATAVDSSFGGRLSLIFFFASTKFTLFDIIEL
jgi:hypothetical protein